jgi:hypothetical protein
MEFTLEESVELPPIEPFEDGEILDAEVAKVSVKDAPWKTDDGVPDKQVEFIFELPGYTVPGKDGGTFTRRVYGNTSTVFSTSTKCKLRAWVTEIMAVDELPAGYRLELENLVGNPCRVMVDKKSWEDKNAPLLPDGTRPTKTGNRVTDVLRAGGVTAARQFDAPKAGSHLLEDDEPF